MTNIMAFTVPDQARSIYICADSQASTDSTKGIAQKLYQFGSTLYAFTGRGNKILAVAHELGKLSNPSLSDILSSMENIGKQFKFTSRKERLHAAVVGLREQTPELYAASLEVRRSGAIQRVANVFDGSGSSKVLPAIERDLETHNVTLSDIVEGLNICFSLGDSAGTDLYVDDKLQIGFVDTNGPHTLYHPKVQLDRTSGFIYLHSNMQVNVDPTKQLSTAEIDYLNDCHGLMNDLYQAMLINCAHLTQADRHLNNINSRIKVQPRFRGSQEEERQLALQERDVYKSQVASLIYAWISRDVDAIADAVQEDIGRRLTYHRSARHYIHMTRNTHLPTVPQQTELFPSEDVK